MEFPIEMYRIKKKNETIKVPCERCVQEGIVIPNCHKCNGQGVHNKTIQPYVISKHTETVEKIDRDEEGNLRYWVDKSTYYKEESKLLHFTKDDAQNECDKLNEDIKYALKAILNETYGKASLKLNK